MTLEPSLITGVAAHNDLAAANCCARRRSALLTTLRGGQDCDPENTGSRDHFRDISSHVSAVNAYACASTNPDVALFLPSDVLLATGRA
jgi:hypothetical protein